MSQLNPDLQAAGRLSRVDTRENFLKYRQSEAIYLSLEGGRNTTESKESENDGNGSANENGDFDYEHVFQQGESFFGSIERSPSPSRVELEVMTAEQKAVTLDRIKSVVEQR